MAKSNKRSREMAEKRARKQSQLKSSGNSKYALKIKSGKQMYPRTVKKSYGPEKELSF